MSKRLSRGWSIVEYRAASIGWSKAVGRVEGRVELRME